MRGATIRQSRWTAVLLATVLLLAALVPGKAEAQLLNLDEVFCELDPALDYCIARQLSALAANSEPSTSRDKAALFAFAGKYLTHRGDEEIRLYPPDPAYYDQFTNSNQIDYVIYILDLVLNPYGGTTLLGTPTWEPSAERVEEANLRLNEMDPGLPRLLAYRYLAESLLRFGTPELAAPYVEALADEIAAIEEESTQIPYLSDLSWLQARAGLTEEALTTAAAIVAIAETHPIPQLRAIFAVEAAAAEGIAGDAALGRARLTAAREALDAIPGPPAGFVAITNAMFAKNYGRIGMLEDARALVEETLPLIEDVELNQAADFLRLLMEAGVY